jgi:DnaK suppressor protein
MPFVTTASIQAPWLGACIFVRLMTHETASHLEPAAERARAYLLRRRKALLSQDDEHDYELSPLDGQRSRDPEERAEEKEAAAALGLLSIEEQRELYDIEAALMRIARGRWGLCEACGHAIGHQLLRAFPERRLCTSCELK